MHRILVVDDEVVITTQLAERLTAMGYDVVSAASSGEESVEVARNLRPDLILMDIVMPGTMDGIDAAEIIGNELGIPVIFLTAHADEKYVDRAKRVNPFGYILKPFNEDQVRATIEIALHKKDAEQSLLDTSEEYHSLLEQLVTAVRETATDPPSGKGLTRPEKIRALQKIISGISHEYNNLFAIIQGNPDLAQSGLEQNKEIAEGLKMLSKATKEGAEAVNRIYESARLKEG